MQDRARASKRRERLEASFVLLFQALQILQVPGIKTKEGQPQASRNIKDTANQVLR